MPTAPEEFVVEAAYSDLAALQRALTSLEGQRACVLPTGTEVASAAPIPTGALPEEVAGPHSPAIWPMALFGGIAGCCAAIWLARWTAMDYPLVTGGMPIVAPPPISIVAFEGTALGAVFATVLSVLWRAHLLPGRRRRPLKLAAQVSAGGLVLRLRAEDEDDALVWEQRLQNTGALATLRSPVGS